MSRLPIPQPIPPALPLAAAGEAAGFLPSATEHTEFRLAGMVLSRCTLRLTQQPPYESPSNTWQQRSATASKRQWLSLLR